MDNDYYNNFLAVSSDSINQHSDSFVCELKESENNTVYGNAPLLQYLSLSLKKTIENLDEELARFETNFSSNKNSIFWTTDYNDVFVFLKKIIKLHNAHSVRLPNINSSTVFRELGIKYFLQDESMRLADDADINFFAVYMMFSDTGSLLLLNQSNNTFSKLTNSAINVFFTSIDRICNSSSWAEVLQQITAYGNGGGRQDMIIFKSSNNCNNYLFIVDNQRTNLLKDSFLRKSLTCLQCGRCNDVCPVFQTIGNEPYNNVFDGPMANIILPFLESYESYKHVPYACTLCGRCEKVCPVNIPLRDLNIHVRNRLLSEGVLEKTDRRMLAVMRKFALSRKKMNGVKFIKNHLLVKYASQSLRKNRELPSFSTESFNKSFKKKHAE